MYIIIKSSWKETDIPAIIGYRGILASTSNELALKSMLGASSRKKNHAK
jgi:hypothetical protein